MVVKSRWVRICLDEDFVFENKDGSHYHTIPGGVPIWISDIRQCTKLWSRFKEMVYKRKGRFCSVCGEREFKKITVHHIIQVSERPELMFDIDNCLVLCRSCHKEKHPNMGWLKRW